MRVVYNILTILATIFYSFIKNYTENEMKENIENKKNNIEKNFQRMEEFDKKLHKKDKTFFYTDFVVEKVIKYGNN